MDLRTEVAADLDMKLTPFVPHIRRNIPYTAFTLRKQIALAEADVACVQVRRCLSRMQHTVIARAMASWQLFTERMAAKRHAFMLHTARVCRRALSAFRSTVLLTLTSECARSGVF